MSTQPGLIGSLINSVLVFCGLLIAGTMTLVSAGAVRGLSGICFWMVPGSLGFALLGGMLALLGMMFAVNLGRFLERLSELSPHGDNDTKSDLETKIKSMRQRAMMCSEFSFWASLVSALGTVGFVIGIVLTASNTQQAEVGSLAVSFSDGSSMLSVDGPVKHVSVMDKKGDCSIAVATGRLLIHLESQSACATQVH